MALEREVSRATRSGMSAPQLLPTPVVFAYPDVALYVGIFVVRRFDEGSTGW